MNGYKLNLTDKTLTITKAFEDAVNTGEGDEYQILMKFQRDIPGLRIVRKTHKTPTKYNNKSGETTRCNQFKNLTYENMERFITGGGISNSEEVMEAYNFIRENASKVSTSPYAVVRKWFAAQFPNYRKDPIFYYGKKVEIISTILFLEAVKKEAERRALEKAQREAEKIPA